MLKIKVLFLFLSILNIKVLSQSNLKPVAQLVASSKQRNIKFDNYSLFGILSKSDSSLMNRNASIYKFNSVSINEIASSINAGLILKVKIDKSNFDLELLEANLFREDFSINTSETLKHGKHYRGIVKGDNNSLVTASFFEDEFYMIISNSRNGNLVFQKGKNKNEQIVYYDKDVNFKNSIKCATIEKSDARLINLNEKSTDGNRTNKCVSLYYEIDHDLYLANNNNLQTTFNWVSAIHNNVSTLFFNDNITVSLRQVFIWTSVDPYDLIDCQDQLALFKQVRPQFDADVGQLVAITPGASCGAADLYGLCEEGENYSYAPVSLVYPDVPNYSGTIHFITHEFGHVLGSPHTHACEWGLFNNQAIDGCSPPIFCSNPGYPSNGGTIMSYCHEIQNVLVNFVNGFGVEPSARIRNKINNADCLESSCLPLLPVTCNVPSNNECYLPFVQIVLPVSNVCTPTLFSTCGATSSGFSSCDGDQDDDVFFSFTTSAITASVSITVTSLDQFDAVFQVLTGPCGTNMQEFNGACINNTGSGGTESVTLTGLLPNTQYFIRLWGFVNGTTPNSHEFEICVVKCDLPDFIAIQPTIFPMMSSSNQTIDFSCKVINRGLTSANPDILKFYLSEDAYLTQDQNGDIFVDSYIITQALPSNDTLTLSNISITLPSSIPNGMYYLYFWIDANSIIEECDEMNNFASTFLTISTPISLTQPAYRFWFDNNFSHSLVTNTTNAPNNLYDIQQNILTNTLVDGLHTLNFQFKDETNDWSSCVSSFFYKTDNKFPSGSPRYQYWFDNNFSLKVTNQFASTNNLNLNNSFNTYNTSSGLHTFNIRFKPDGKHWSSISSSFFYKTKIIPIGTPKYEFWLDQNYENRYSQNITSTNILILLNDIEVDTISNGLHTFNIRFRPEGKYWSSTSSTFFYKPIEVPEGDPQYEFWIDQNYNDRHSQNITSTTNLILLNHIDVDTVSSGLHTFNIRFRPDGKTWSTITSSFFYKVPEEILGQAKYQYWFDNNLQDSITQNINDANPFVLLNDIVTSALSNGLHTFNIRFKPDGKKWSIVSTSFFVKGDHSEGTISKCVYWFDSDYPNYKTVTFSGQNNVEAIIQANTNDLTQGEHVVAMFFSDNLGYWSSIVLDTFVKNQNNTPCPADQIFISGISSAGAMYQWQVDEGIGFLDIQNGINYSGTNTDSLHIMGSPSSFYGNKYRCEVTLGNTSNFSDEHILTFVYIWTGTINNEWENPMNWNCNGVPIVNSDVIINNGIVVIDSNPNIGSITTGQGTLLDINENRVLNISGH